MGFLNGLSAMGASTAAFAATAGLEAQKATLAAQNLTLADQLQGARETAGRTQAGDIAAAAATQQQAATAANLATTEAGANTRSAASNATSINVAGISAASAANTAGIQAASQKYATDVHSKDVYAQIDAAKPEQQARILQQQQQTAMAAVQTQNAQDLQGAHAALAAETASPTPDPDKIKNLKNQVTSLETSATTEAATTTAAAAMYKTDMESVQHFNTQLTTATAQLNQMAMGDEGREAQKGLVQSLQTQLNGAQKSLSYSSDLVHGRVGAASGLPAPGVAPPPPPGVPAGARYSPSMKIWQGPDGSLFDAKGSPTTAPGRGLMNGGGGAAP